MIYRKRCLIANKWCENERKRVTKKRDVAQKHAIPHNIVCSFLYRNDALRCSNENSGLNNNLHKQFQ